MFGPGSTCIAEDVSEKAEVDDGDEARVGTVAAAPLLLARSVLLACSVLKEVLAFTFAEAKITGGIRRVKTEFAIAGRCVY